ncbi:MAG: threonine--tRNA ligase [Malacoplasma sp.]|nr:threonine--tRNA ligase [Malacoplasma sp.]
MKENNNKLNNTAMQVLLKALQNVYKNNFVIASCGNLEQGFYVDFKTDDSVSTNDFDKIEKAMSKVASSGERIEKIASLSNPNKYQKYALENNKNAICIKIANSFENVVNSNEIETNVNQVKYFALVNVSGSYWLNDTKNEQLTRISGVCFETQKELDDWKKYIIELRESDHRKIGQEMEIFAIDNDIGQGLPIWLPNGEIIKKEIKKFLWDVFTKEKFMFVDTPILGSKELYIKSGHWDHYKENNFPPLVMDNETYMLRPMTCPHHLTFYNLKPHSYKELPFCICEDSKLHRYEASGGLIGLERVRFMELFDVHIIAMHSQIEEVIFKLNSILNSVHKKLNIKIDRIDLSLRDKNDTEKYHQDDKMWNTSENELRRILKKLNYQAVEIEGEAAFYGPKIDFQARSNLGKMITISTIQLDFLLPERFQLEYIDKDNSKQRPVLIHLGIIGTYERFIATLLSQTKGNLPFWLAPVQVTIIPINNESHLKYCNEIGEELTKNKIRYKINDSFDRLAKKVRDSQIAKVPLEVIIGENEVSKKQVTYRKHGQKESVTVSIKQFIDLLNSLKNN